MKSRKRSSRTPCEIVDGIWGVVLIVLAFVGYTMWSRKTQDADLAYKQQQAKSAQQRESDAAAVEELGGSDFKILAFYASPGLIHRGRHRRHVLRRFEREDGEARSSGGECLAFGEPLHAGNAEENDDVYADH